MPRKSEEIARRIDVLFDFADDAECTIELRNMGTGETVTPDAKAVKAGLLAGLAAASVIADDVMNGEETPIEETYKYTVGAAGKSYLETMLAEACVVDHG